MPSRSLPRASLTIAPIVFLIAACSGGTATTAPGSSTPPASTPPASSAPASSAPGSAAASPAASVPAASPGSSVPQGTIDAATLVTADMAASIIGGSPTAVAIPGGVFPGGAATAIAYTTAAGDTVTVMAEQVPGLTAASLQAAMAVAGQQGDLQTVGDLGDFAGKQVTPNEATYAFVKGTYLILIAAQSGSMSGSDLDPKVLGVALQVASGL